MRERKETERRAGRGPRPRSFLFLPLLAALSVFSSPPAARAQIFVSTGPSSGLRMFAPGASDWWLNPLGGTLNLLVGGNAASPVVSYLNSGNVGVSSASPQGLFVVGNGTLTVTSGGNVGVGITSPQTNLHVSGTAASALTVTSSNYPTTYKTQLGSWPGGRGILVLGNSGANEIRFGNTAAGGYGAIYVNNTVDYASVANGTLAMTFDSGGNVGIGTAVPGAKLDVAGIINTNSVYEVGGSTALSVNGNGNVFAGVYAGTTTTAYHNAFVGYQAGASDTTGYGNSFLGFQAGYGNKDGVNNTILGANAGVNASASDNVFIGASAGSNSTGGVNVFVGENAGLTNTTGSGNTFVGENAGYNNTTGSSNIFVGRLAGNANTSGAANVFAGFQAGQANTIGADDTFLGYQAGYGNVSGNFNVFVGESAGIYSTGNSNTIVGESAGANVNNTASNNTFMGQQSGHTNTTGSFNAFFGYLAGQLNTTGGSNTFLGAYAGAANTTATDNTMLGYDAGGSNTTGMFNTFLGDQAGVSNTTASSNTIVGWGAGASNQTGQGNVLLGFRAGASETGSNKLYIANSNTASPLIHGDFSVSEVDFNGSVGIGTTNPQSPLHVQGQGVQIGNASTNVGANVRFLGSNTQNNWMVGNQMNGNFFEITPSVVIGSTTFTTPAIVVNNSGSVGIGTTSPGAPLHVYGTAILGPTASLGASNLMIDEMSGNGIRLSSGVPSGDFELDMDANGLHVNPWNGFGPNVFTMTTGGLVGLGTTAPTTTLSVYGVITSSSSMPSFSCDITPTSISPNSNNQSGEFTVGSGGSKCTITFSVAWPKKPSCFCQDQTTTRLWSAGPISTTAVTCDDHGVNATGEVINYFCFAAP